MPNQDISLVGAKGSFDVPKGFGDSLADRRGKNLRVHARMPTHKLVGQECSIDRSHQVEAHTQTSQWMTWIEFSGAHSVVHG